MKVINYQEIYLDIYENHPERVKAIYIRHVYTDNRKKELEEIAKNTDVPFLIMSHSSDAVQNATEKGWVG